MTSPGLMPTNTRILRELARRARDDVAAAERSLSWYEDRAERMEAEADDAEKRGIAPAGFYLTDRPAPAPGE